MEVSLRQGTQENRTTGGTSFNPCFIGSISEALSCPALHAKPKRVSILVLLEVSLRQLYTRYTEFHNFCFNPCFIGSISEAIYRGCWYGVETSFNPCFIGSISEALLSAPVSAQVASRFNPCFIGSISEACQFRIYPLLVAMFQSLFYWKYL